MNLWLQKIGKTKKGPLFFVSLFLVFGLFFPVSATGTETLITTYENGYSHESPKISGDQIVWQDSLSPLYSVIHLYNVSSGIETQITDNVSYVRSPVINGDLVAWIDCAQDSWCFESTVYLYNITSGLKMPVSGTTGSRPEMPAIYGNRIVWQDCSGVFCSIFINGTSPGQESRIATTESNQINPSVNGNTIVWQDDRNDPGNKFDIYLYDLTTSIETRLTTDPANQTNPAVFGNRIVWQDERNNYSEIFINGTDPGREYSLTPNSPVNAEHPAIHGNLVVWQQTRGGANYDIYANNTLTGEKIPISVIPPAVRNSPSVSGSRVVWQDDRNGKNNIYLFTLGVPGTCPVANFSHDFSGGAAPAVVNFNDQSTLGATHWSWDFGDGSTSTVQNPRHTFLQNSAYTVSLTVGNPGCRNITRKINDVVVGRPVADFIASPTSEIVPALITFSDRSSGLPVSWLWDFGDGSNSTLQNPSHTYTQAGTYRVCLTATNAYGSSAKIRPDYITVLNGANEVADTAIFGLSVTHCAGPQSVTVDTSLLSSVLIPNNSVLEIQPPPDRGFKNITLYAFDGTGFTRSGALITGNVTGVTLATKVISTTGFSARVGSPVSVHYSLDLPAYPCNGLLNTRIWEGAIPADRPLFDKIAVDSQFSNYSGTAYSMKISRTNIPPPVKARLHMSVNATWASSNPGGRNKTFIERISDDRMVGEVLDTRFESHDPVHNLDYFEADSPHGLSTFGLSTLSGAGNPFQLITLTVGKIISPPSDTGSDYNPSIVGEGAGKPVAPAPVPTANPPRALAPVDPGKTEKIYANAQGVITQATLLQSTDQLARLSVGTGVIAKDRTGAALTSVTITALPADSLPTTPATAGYTGTGMAYTIEPDGATFSPAVPFSLIYPQAQWAEEYSVKTFDQQSGTWQDLPTIHDAGTGRITAQVSHFCTIALFAKPIVTATPPPRARAPAEPVVPGTTPPPPPGTALNIFIGIMSWITGLMMNNVYVLVIVAVLGIAYYVKTRKYPGP